MKRAHWHYCGSRETWLPAPRHAGDAPQGQKLTTNDAGRVPSSRVVCGEPEEQEGARTIVATMGYHNIVDYPGTHLS